MSRKRSSRVISGAAKRRWTFIGLGAFVIADILLVALAFSSTRAPASGAVPAAAPTASARTMPTAEPTATARPTPTAAPDAVAPTRVLGAIDANTAWRAAVGSCPGPAATMELSVDGGATWTQASAGGASAVLRILPDSASQVSAVTLASQGCTPQYIRTYVSGQDWATYNSDLAGAWYVAPASPASIHSPQGAVTAPCPAVVGLAARDSATAAVLCSDHRVFQTTTAGATWDAGTAVAGGVAIASYTDGYSVATAGAPGCAGVAIAHLAAGAASSTPVGCFTTSTPAPGTVALSSGGSTLWLWAGDAVARSGDGGATWR